MPRNFTWIPKLAIVEAGDTFSKPSLSVSMLIFGHIFHFPLRPPWNSNGAEALMVPDLWGKAHCWGNTWGITASCFSAPPVLVTLGPHTWHFIYYREICATECTPKHEILHKSVENGNNRLLPSRERVWKCRYLVCVCVYMIIIHNTMYSLQRSMRSHCQIYNQKAPTCPWKSQFSDGKLHQFGNFSKSVRSESSGLDTSSFWFCWSL